MKKPKAHDKSTEGRSEEYHQSLQTQNYMQSIEFAIDIVHDQPQKLFHALTDPQIISGIDRNSYSWCNFLRREARPAQESQVEISYFLAIDEADSDLLQYLWTWQGHKLRIVENFTVAQLDIPLPQNVPQEKLRVAKQMFEELVITQGKDWKGEDYQVTMQWPDAVSSGVSFSSNPEAWCYPVSLWHERVDAYVRKNMISFIFRKFNPLRARAYVHGDNKDWLHHRFRGLTDRNIASPSSRKKSAED